MSTPVFLSAHHLEGLPTKAKEYPCPQEMRLSPAGHQPIISWSIIIIIIIIIIVIANRIKTVQLKSYAKFYTSRK